MESNCCIFLGPSLKNLKTFPKKIQTEPNFPIIFKLMYDVLHFDEEFIAL